MNRQPASMRRVSVQTLVMDCGHSSGCGREELASHGLADLLDRQRVHE
jgi:hypothetical protein